MLEQRPFLTLAALLIFHLFLMSIQVRNPEGQTLVRSYATWLLTPLASGLGLLTEQVESVLDRYLLLAGAEEENERLRRENTDLKLRLAQLREEQLLSRRWPGLDRFSQELQFEVSLASVIWRSAPFQTNRILIDAGSSRGVRKDTAVITADGVVGRVLTTTPLTAEVELLINSGAAAGALVGDSRLQGVIQGRGASLLHLEFVPNYEKVETGEVVYTSGTDQIYPKGLPIGRVVKSERGSMIYREIEVQPFADYRRLEEVLFIRAD